MPRLIIPAVHVPHGREVFRTLPYRPGRFRAVLKAYAERGLLRCVPGDAVALPSAPDNAWLEFLLKNGVGTERIFLCPGGEKNFARDVLADAPLLEKLRTAGEPEFYIHLEEENEIAALLGRPLSAMLPPLTRMFNTLYFLIRLEEDLAIAGPPRRMVRSSRFAEPALKMLREGGPLFVRGNESCGGSQAFALKTEDDVEAAVRRISRNRVINRYFVMPLLDVRESWNVQYRLGGGAAELYGASLQALDGPAHRGNSGGPPLPADVAALAEKIAVRLASMGGVGFIGVDFVTAGGKTHVAEINARENTSTPILAVQKTIKAPLWRVLKIAAPRGFGFREFADTFGKENLLDAKTGRGLLPYHFAASALTGALDVALFAESAEELDRLSALVAPAAR